MFLTPGRKHRRGHPIQSAVWPVMIVIQPPAVQHISGLRQAQEQLAVEALVPQLAVETLHVAVLPRTARFNKQCSDSGLPKPLSNSPGSKLRTIVASKVSRCVPHGKQILQNLHDIPARKVTGHLDRQAFPGIFVHHVQQPQSSAPFGPVTDKVIGPDMVLMLRTMPVAGVLAVAQTPAFTLYLANLKSLGLPTADARA